MPAPKTVPTLAAALLGLVVAHAAHAAGSCNASPALLLPPTPPAGPGVLHAPAYIPPQFANHQARFVSTPLLVSGHEQYQDGEYSYQDYVFDDFGAETTGGPFTTSVVTSPATGTATPDAANFRAGEISYPSNQARFGNNAADLLELRIAPGADDLAYRVTFNTLLAKDTTMAVVAWNKDGLTTTGTSTLAHGTPTAVNPGISLPGTDEAIFLWNNAAGVGGEHIAYSGVAGATLTRTALSVTVDLVSNQMTVLVPRAVHNPTGTGWKYVVMAGLHNGSGTWLMPGTSASATAPGGAGEASPQPPAIFDINNHVLVPNGQAGGKTGELCHYLDTPCDLLQSISLRQVNGFAAPNLTPFARAVDFDALAAGTSRTSLPAEGTPNPDKKSVVRLFGSRIASIPEGRMRMPDEGQASSTATGLGDGPANDRVFLGGSVQAYSLYVPSGYRSNAAAPLLLNNHSLGQYHWQYNGTRFNQEAGEKRGALIATPNSRAPDGFYVGRNEIDHFEVTADVRRHYRTDPLRTHQAGYSMGGYATYRMTSLYPDLYAAAYGGVGPPGAGIWPGTAGVGDLDNPNGTFNTLTNYWLENLRHVPHFNEVVVTDYLVPISGPRQQNLGGVDGTGEAQSFEDLGYRYTYQEFQTGEHLTLFANDSYPRVKDFLNQWTLNPNPAHVTFSYVPASDYTLPAAQNYDGSALTLKHDHAYWVSGLVLRDTAASPLPPSFKAAKGTIDAISHAFGVTDPAVNPQTQSNATLAGGNVSPALAYTEYGRTWGAPGAAAVQNRLQLTLTNLAAVQVDAARAALTLDQSLVIDTTSDGVSELRLAGVVGNLSAEVLEDGNPLCAAQLARDGLIVPVNAGAHRYTLRLVGPANLRFVERFNVPLNSFITSERITLAGFGGSLPIVAAAGSQYSIDGAPFTSADGTVMAGQTVAIRHVSAATAATETTTSIQIGGVTAVLKTTTTADDRIPHAFDFGQKTGQTAGQLSTSVPITLTGYNASAPISAGPGAEYSIDNGAFTRASGQLPVGASLRIRHLANSQRLGYTKTYVMVGGVAGYYVSRTK